MDRAIQYRRRTLFVFFFLIGLSMASWITRTPAIRDGLGINLADMGLVLFGLSLGSMFGILSAGWLVARFGTRRITQLGLWLVVASLVTIGLGITIALPPVVGLGLMFFGLGMGTAEIAVNVDGADIEHSTKTHLLHALHGCYSLGTVCGALLGMVLNAAEFSVVLHLWAIAALAIVPILRFMRYLPASLGMAGTGIAAATPETPVWRDTRLYFIGFIVLAMALAEGAANDWLPLLMVDEFSLNPTSASAIFLGFAAAMTIGRFAGGFFLRHFGRKRVMFSSAVIGAAGLTIVISSGNPTLAGGAVLLWGLGTSLGFPVAISAAGDSGPNPVGRVRLVSVSGYIAFLVGPPLLGFVGEAYSLRNAMAIVLSLVVLAAVATLSVGSAATK